MLSVLVPYLQDMGAETIHRAIDGDAALEFLYQPRYRIDVVICDWDLPKRSGLELLQFVRKNAPGKLFLMMSSNVTQASIKAAAKHGVNGYLAKPFTVLQLEQRVARLIGSIPENPAKALPADAKACDLPPENAKEEPDDETWLI